MMRRVLLDQGRGEIRGGDEQSSLKPGPRRMLRASRHKRGIVEVEKISSQSQFAFAGACTIRYEHLAWSC